MIREIEVKQPIKVQYISVYMYLMIVLVAQGLAFNWQTQGPGNCRRSKNRDRESGYPWLNVLSRWQMNRSSIPGQVVAESIGSDSPPPRLWYTCRAHSIHVTGTNLSKYVCTLLLYWQVWIAGEDQRMSVGRQLPNWIKRRTWLQCRERFTLAGCYSLHVTVNFDDCPIHLF